MTRKPPVNPVRWQPPPVDPLPDMPAPSITVVPLPGNGPEDVVVDAAGQLWTGLQDGRIVRIPADGGQPATVADTGGRPLGLHVARDGRVLICDSYRGLLALDPTSGRLDVLVEQVDFRQLKFCSNVTETSDGTIYFTESTRDFNFEHFTAPILEARGTGALFRLDADGTVTTLVDGLYFANGLTPTADGPRPRRAGFRSTGWPGRRPDRSHRWRCTCPACPTTCPPAPTAESGPRWLPR
jgi:sugar lactone lactonase YvrE